MAFINERRLHKYIESQLKSTLRAAFASDTDYPWTSNIRTTALYIDTYYAQNLRNPERPSVVIKHPTIDTSRRTFGDHVEFEQEQVVVPGVTIDGTYYNGVTVFSPVREIRGWDMPGTVTLEVVSYREDVFDDIQYLLSDYLLDYQNLRANGLIVTSVNVGPRTEVRIGNDVYYSGDVDLGILTSWQGTETITGDRIGKIVAITPTILSDGTTSF